MADDLFASSPSGAPHNYDASAIEVLEGLEPVRRRPGMYIGGIDERALHHLAAEVLDNAMDEAVAGHATRIEVTLAAGNRMTIVDNGRGMPVDAHPKFPGKSALEVILTMLHSGGKFSDKAYATSGGLHGVGISVVNALSTDTVVEVARDRTLYRQTFAQRAADIEARNDRPHAQPARHQRRLHARHGDFRRGRALQAGAALPPRPFQGLSVCRRRDTLALRSGADRRRHAARSRLPIPRRACRSSPRATGRARLRHGRALHRPPGFPQRPGLGRMGGGLAALFGRLLLLLLQHHPDTRRRHA
jgi:hypothetical protein